MRAHRAAEAARDDGESPAMAAALARNRRRLRRQARSSTASRSRSSSIIRLGPDHPAVRARFEARAAMLRGRSLDAAIVTVERWRRDEQRAFAIASAFGRGSRLSLEVLDELRLLLRWLRFKRLHADYATALAALSGDAPAFDRGGVTVRIEVKRSVSRRPRRRSFWTFAAQHDTGASALARAAWIEHDETCDDTNVG